MKDINKPKAGQCCVECHKLLDADATGDAEPVKHTNKRWYHADCLELVLWRRETTLLKPTKGGNKVPHACGRIIRGSKSLGG